MSIPLHSRGISFKRVFVITHATNVKKSKFVHKHYVACKDLLNGKYH